MDGVEKWGEGGGGRGSQPTNRVGHLVPAEVEVGSVGLDHRRGAVERTDFLVVANVCDRKQGRLFSPV